MTSTAAPRVRQGATAAPLSPVGGVCSECGRPHDKSPVLEFGPIRMERPSQRVWVRGEEKRLRRGEFLLLWMICQRRGAIAPHWWLLNEIGYDGDNVFYIHDLVKKLRAVTGDRGLIQSVYGEGFRVRVTTCA